jgi:colanic acid/amylovoran biosynthesis protein
MKIFLIGQCTLHWGRMEFGNIGSYYVIEPLFRQLHRVFPNAKIVTTFQMSQNFSMKEKIDVLPIELYYGWQGNDLDIALMELSSAKIFNATGFLPRSTPYINEVMSSDLIIDFSGDIWGDNANFLGKDRFLVGLCKDRVAQLLGKPTVMIAGSPGPFKNQQTLNFAKEVFENFKLVTNREPLSFELLKKEKFNVSNVKNLACPAFLFEPAKKEEVKHIINTKSIANKTTPAIGFIICGWNFPTGPFNKWPREDKDYSTFVETVEFISSKLGTRVYLMSHSNGFPIPPKKFKLLHGRDFLIIKQLQKILKDRDIAKNVFVLDDVYTPKQTKAIIGQFDMLISGRLHAAVVGLSQYVPTVIIDYSHEPKAHKLKGFATLAEVEDYIVNPASKVIMINKIKQCWENRINIKNNLKKNIPKLKKLALMNFDLLKDLIYKQNK